MPVALQADYQQQDAAKLRKQAVNLLSQQVWCWGQDILRPEGNWLLELGFQRIESPADRENCSSVYALELLRGRRVVLRGFGVFYGDDQQGGIFLPRYEFGPLYTTLATLKCPPWSATDLPIMSAPDNSQRDACASLAKDLIDWIRTYEMTIVERLGVEYRRSTLEKWNNDKRQAIPGEEMADAWRELSLQVASNYDSLIR